MPLFTYVCEECATSIEALVKNGENVPCPSCGSVRVSKQLGRFAAVTSAPSAASGPSDCDMGSMCCGGGCGFSPN